MEKCVKKVGIYAPNQPSTTSPFAEVEKQTARAMVLQGLATWINCSRGIRLKRLSEKLSDASSYMGPHVVEACWDERPWAVAIAEAWRNRQLGGCE